MRRSISAAAIVATAAAAVVAGMAGTAHADSGTGGTPVSFTVAGGGLSINVPSATVDLGSVNGSALGGLTNTGSLGTTTVTDNRALSLTWSSTVAGPAAGWKDAAGDVIPTNAASVYVDTLTSVVGSLFAGGVAIPVTTATVATPMALSTSPQTFVTMAKVLGSSTSSYVPHVAISVPGTANAGTYTGTITQTVS